MIPRRKALGVPVPPMPLDKRGKPPTRKRFEQLSQNRILIAHAKLPLSSLDNRKVPAKPRRSLACSRDLSTHSPDTPARRREPMNADFNQPCTVRVHGF